MSDQPNQMISLDCLVKQAGEIDDLRRKLAEAQAHIEKLEAAELELKKLKRVPCRETGIHILGCDEYHAHHVPDCCDITCWCNAALAPKEDDHAL